MRKLCLATLALLFGIGLLTSENVSADVKSPTVVTSSMVVGTDPLLTLRAVTLKPGTTVRQKRVKQLLAALDAIRDRGLRMSKRYRMRIINAALNAQAKTGVDATLMLAIARMESDFRNLTLINSACKFGQRKVNCYADCGMTQHHVRGSMAYVLRECKRLKNPMRSFYKSAKELARHVTWCKKPKNVKRDGNLRRCVLNRYNMGPAYKTHRKCKRWHNPWRGWTRLRRHPGETRRQHRSRMRKFMKTQAWRDHYRAVKKQQWKCRSRASYWIKVSCFEYGARNATKSKRSCRRCHALRDIRLKFYLTPTKVDPRTAFLFGKRSR